MSEPEIVGFDPPSTPQSVNIVTHLPAMMRKRSQLERQLRQVNRDIEWLERKQARAEFVAADRVNAGRLDIPTLPEIVEWDVKFRAEYRRLHEARNDAALKSTDHIVTTDEGYGQTVAQSPQEILAEGDVLEELDAAATSFAEPASEIRGAGFDAAAELVGLNDPRLSLLTCPYEPKDEKHIPWWTGAYQRIGLL